MAAGWITPASVVLAASMSIGGAGASLAEEFPTAPRTPMAPGTGVFKRQFEPGGGGALFMPPGGGNPAMWGGELTRRPMVPRPDLVSLETQAISELSNGKSEVVVSSRADTTLILQLYRPDQSQWQTYKLAPLSNTEIACPGCAGKFKFAFNDGIKQSEIDIEAPALLRIYPSSSGDRWGWDILKLQAASTASEQP